MGPPKGFRPGEFRRVADFAEAHLEDALSLEAWAGVLGMPTPEFTRRFRATTGYPPFAWFMQRRIERAKELLRLGRTSIGEVAFRVGFCSQSHFTDAFRRRVGTSPARWVATAVARSGQPKPSERKSRRALITQNQNIEPAIVGAR
jgi:AraC family transcriptional regulator